MITGIAFLLFTHPIYIPAFSLLTDVCATVIIYLVSQLFDEDD
jgi:hypothetical protein